jgi:hypothetical protein
VSVVPIVKGWGSTTWELRVLIEKGNFIEEIVCSVVSESSISVESAAT